MISQRTYIGIIRISLALAAPLIGASAVAQLHGMGWLITYSILCAASTWTLIEVGERSATTTTQPKDTSSCCKSRTRRGQPTH